MARRIGDDSRHEWFDNSLERVTGERRHDPKAVAAWWRTGAVLEIGRSGDVSMTEESPDDKGLQRSGDMPGADRGAWLTRSLGELTADEPGEPRSPGDLPPWHVTLIGTDSIPYDAQRHVFLGIAEGTPVFCDLECVPRGRTIDVKAALPLLIPAEGEAVVTAAALLNWHHAETHCASCGHPTVVWAAGASRWCAACEREWFPRTDPAIIVAVTDADDRLLLGRRAGGDPTRFSVLAGFVEAGECPADTIVREVREEAGIDVGDQRPFDSQPWPFPRSLMLAYTARALPGGAGAPEPHPDGEEIAEARWFSRRDVADGLDSGTLTLPGRCSIAYRLIRAWYVRRHPTSG